MTVKELIERLEEIVYTDPERAYYTVKMVGYDIDGERCYDIDIDDIGTDRNEKVLHLWDD